MKRLDQIDTNLLVALDVLLEERHVTRAASRLAVTQSAMSQTLRRLRDTFEDPLLVRSGASMVPTPRAKALRAPLRTALRALEEALNVVEQFDPTQATRRFKVSSLDVYGLSLVPRLMNLLASAGPGLELSVVPLDVTHVFEQLRAGDTEVAIVGTVETPSDIDSTWLLEEKMLAIVRENHPILNAPITPQTYVSWPHAVFRFTGRGNSPVDRRLAALGVERRIVGRTPHFLSAPALVAQSDTIVTVPRSIALVFGERWPIAVFEPPFPPITYGVYLVWPKYLEAEPGHRWFREQMLAIGNTMEGRFMGL